MKKKIIYLVSVLVINFIGFVILSPETFNLCSNNCFTNSVTFGVGQPIFFGMAPITLIFIIFLFIKDENKIDKLCKLFLYYIFISIIIITIMPLSCNALDPICITKSTVAVFLGVLFLVVSLVKIIRK